MTAELCRYYVNPVLLHSSVVVVVVVVDTDDMCRRVAALWCEVHDQSGHGSRPHNYSVKASSTLSTCERDIDYFYRPQTKFGVR